MEEKSQIHNQINNKSQTTFPNSLLQALYTYSSRYLPNMEKQKIQENTDEKIPFNNEPLVKEAKQKVMYNYDILNNYINNLDEKLQELNQNQLDNLSEKHRYFLRKFKKYVAEHKKLSQIYESLQNTVMQSPSVQDQINSINFINMVSAQTQQKLAQLKSTVSIAENQKINNHNKIQQLRKQLNMLKSQFFAKKRQQVSYQTQIQTRQKRLKERQLEEKMKKIRVQKRQKDTLIKDIFHSKTQNSQQKFDCFKITKRGEQDPFFSSIDSVLEQFKSINSNSKSYLRSLQQTKQNFRSRKLEEKKRLNNKLVEETNLQDFRIKSRQQKRFKKTQEDELMKNQQIVKQMEATNKLHDQFMKKSSKQILDILTNNKKLKSLLEIIEQIKATQIKQDVIEKRNINFFRSQVYRNNTPYLAKNQSFDQLANSAIVR